MIKKRFKKYSHFSQSVFQAQKLKKLGNYPAEKTVKKALLHVKKGDYDKEDWDKLTGLAEYAKKLGTNQSEITYEVFNIDKKRRVNEIARHAATPKKWCEFFYFLTKFSGAENVLEIGTNLGISGQYFLSALPPEESGFTTLEGVGGLCALASKRFGELASPSRFNVVQGLYDLTLPQIALTGQKFNIVFFDGNHRFEPTLHYFNLLKKNYSQNTILIFDDIYWSGGMEKAWRQLQKEPGVYCSIDLFKLGIILFDPAKKHLPKNELKLFLGF